MIIHVFRKFTKEILQTDPRYTLLFILNVDAGLRESQVCAKNNSKLFDRHKNGSQNILYLMRTIHYTRGLNIFVSSSLATNACVHIQIRCYYAVFVWEIQYLTWLVTYSVSA